MITSHRTIRPETSMPAAPALPSLREVERQIAELHDRQAELLLALGRRRLLDEPIEPQQSALRELREELEALAAAARVLEASR